MMATREMGAPLRVSSLGKRRCERYEIYICDLPQADNKNSDEIEPAGPKKRGMREARVQGERRARNGRAVSQSPGPKRISVVNPRRQCAEQGCSRPRLRMEFTTDLCWDLVTHGGQAESLRIWRATMDRGKWRADSNSNTTANPKQFSSATASRDTRSRGGGHARRRWVRSHLQEPRRAAKAIPPDDARRGAARSGHGDRL